MSTEKVVKVLAKQLLNVGPKLAAKLVEIGIDSPEKLRQIGAKYAFNPERYGRTQRTTQKWGYPTGVQSSTLLHDGVTEHISRISARIVPYQPSIKDIWI